MAGGRQAACRRRRSPARARARAASAGAPWHHAPVTDQAERYDRIALGYARWWAPVLAPAVAELLDAAEPSLAGGERLIDIGTGTGQLALGAIARWPGVVGRRGRRLGRDGRRGRCRGRPPALGRGPRTLPVGRRVRRRAARSGTATFDGRALVVRVPARPEPRAGAARGPARPASRARRWPTSRGSRTTGVFAPDATFDDVLDEFDFERREPATADRATSRRSIVRPESCAGPGSRT